MPPLKAMAIAMRASVTVSMSDEMIADKLATFLFAGHETTAKLLTWTLYILARAPEWQERLREELYATIGSGPIDAGTIAKLPIMSRVLKEVMPLPAGASHDTSECRGRRDRR